MFKISSEYSGSSRWCVFTSVAKVLAAFYSFVVQTIIHHMFFFVSCCFISPFRTCIVSILNFFCVMYASIQCLYASRLAFDAFSVTVLLYLNNFSMTGVFIKVGLNKKKILTRDIQVQCMNSIVNCLEDVY